MSKTKDLSTLSSLDRQPLEVGERGVAGPEVVDREPDAEVGAAGGARRGCAGVAHDARLGDLERQPLRRGPLARARSTARCRAKLGVQEAAGRRRSPRRQLEPAPRHSRRGRERRHHVRVSGRMSPVCSATGMNSSGETGPCTGWLPPHERLDAGTRRSGGRPAAGSAEPDARRASIALRRSASSAAGVRWSLVCLQRGRARRPCCAAFAAYIATSARWSSSARPCRGRGRPRCRCCARRRGASRRA